MKKNLRFFVLSAALTFTIPFASAQTRTGPPAEQQPGQSQIQAGQTRIQSGTDIQTRFSTVGVQTISTQSGSSPLRDALGQPQSLQNLLGQKTVVLVINNRPDPYLPTLANQYKDDVVILTVQSTPQTMGNADQLMGQAYRAAEPNLWAATEAATRIQGDTRKANADKLDADRFGSVDNSNAENYYIIIDKNQRVHSFGVIAFDTRTTEAKNHELSEALAAAAVSSGTGVGAINTDTMDQDRASRIGRTGSDAIRSPTDVRRNIDTAHTVRSSEIVGHDVENKSGEELGEVKTFLVDLSSGKVAYALLSVGGVLGIGDKTIAVPWNALQFQGANQDEVIVDLAKDRLNQLPSLDDQEEDAFTDPDWHKQVASTYGIAPQSYTQLVRLSELKSFEVENSAGEDLGEIEELMIDVRNGNCSFAVLEFGGFLGIGDKLIAIPWNRFRIDSSNESIVLDIPKDRLEKAPNFDRENWPGADDDTWNNNINFFNQ